ncbi:MAG: DUF2380 domain-containing protein [Acidobacteriota bacterium]|nr:DUF2380 domain-containing protein [Acidobacteriota bacterium]
MRLNLHRIISSLLVFSILAVSTPIAPAMIVNQTAAASQDFNFWFASSGWSSFITQFWHQQEATPSSAEDQETRDAKVVRIEILDNEQRSFVTGEAIYFLAVPYDANNKPVPGVKMKWSVDEPRGRVRHFDDGVLYPETPGEYTVKVKAAGRSAEKKIKVIGGNLRSAASADVSEKTGTNSAFENNSANLLLDSGEWNPDNVGQAFTPTNQRGAPAGKVLRNNNFQMAVPLVSLPGRGIDLDLNMYYNSQVWSAVNGSMNFDMDRDYPGAGWNLGFDRLINLREGGMLMISEDGTRRGFTPTSFVRESIDQYQMKETYKGQTNDGSNIKVICTTTFVRNSQTGATDIQSSSTLRFPDGTTETFTGSAYTPTATDPLPSTIYLSLKRIYDNNGNYISVNIGAYSIGITDTLGRIIRIDINYHSDGSVRSHTVNVIGPYVNGVQEYKVVARLEWVKKNLSPNFSGYTVNAPQQYTALKAVFYPRTSTADTVTEEKGSGYWFDYSDSYSPYGMIRKVSEEREMRVAHTPLPSSGYTLDFYPGTVSRERTYDYPLNSSTALTDVPRYSSVTENWEGAPSRAVTTYSVDESNSSYNITTIEGPFREGTTQGADHIKTKEYTHKIADSKLDGITFKTEVLDGDGVLRSKTEVNWELGANNVPRPTRIDYTEKEPGTSGVSLTKSVVYDAYEPNIPYNRVTEMHEEDYHAEGGTGTTIRKVKTTYIDIGDLPEDDITPVNVNDPGKPRFLSLPSVVETFEGNNRIDYTKYEYDQFSLQAFPSNTNPPPQFVEPTTTNRGNLTTVTEYTNITNSTLGGALSVNTYYDKAGNAVKNIKPGGMQTIYNFTSASAYAYPVSVQYGSGQQTITESFNVDIFTGLLLDSTDAEGFKTIISYDPFSWRQTKITSPTNARVEYDYDDVNLTTKTTLYSADNQVVGKKKTKSNGFGLIAREEEFVETVTNNDGTTSDIWNVVETKYDLLGRVWKTSNPFRSNVSQTGTDWTVNEYDAAGRLSSVTSPDGSISRNFYNEAAAARPQGIGVSTALGKTVRAVDPVGREKWALFDVDENLIEIVEPKPDGDGKVANNGLLTIYQYDRLGQLNQINQGAQQRRFRYDGLGRLTHEKMAEQDATLNDEGVLVGTASGVWSTVYKYDDRSNLVSQIDARGVKTSFSYQPEGSSAGQLDPLNRLFSVSYETNGAQNVLPSAAVKYAYDPAKLLRLTSVTTTNVSTESFGYDSQGRFNRKETVLAERPLKPLEIRYTYDSLNRVTDVYYPKQYGNGTEAQKNLHYDYKTGSKLDNLKVDNVLYASNTAFNVNDQLTSIKIGPSGINQITETYDFNPKNGLLNNQKVTRGSAVLLDLTYNYQFPGGVTGQLRGIINNLDRNKDRAYEYDALGRLKKVTGGINQGWSQTYVYDRYGNRQNVISSGFESLRTRGDVETDDKQISNKGSLTRPINSSQLIEKVNSLAKTKEIRQAIDPKRNANAPHTKQGDDSHNLPVEPSQTESALQKEGIKHNSSQGGLNERLSSPPAKTPFDFDGDGKADISAWRRSNGNWTSQRSGGSGQTTVQLGASGNQIAPGDYDGDGKTDEAIWNPDNGLWTIRYSLSGNVSSQYWGTKGDAIVPADYDGDGKTDLAVWRPSTGYWYALRSSDGSWFVYQWGHQRFGDIPVVGDYDGDGKADTAVWRPSNGNWYVLVMQSGSGQILDIHWGATGDVPVPADYDGDNKTDLAVWRPSTGYWYISRSSDNQFVPVQLGDESQRDIMVPADYDGDRKADVAVWRPSTGTWTIKQSTTNTNVTYQLGASGDVAVPSAYVRRSSAPRGQSVEIPRDGWESISYDSQNNRISASSGYWYDATGNQTRAKQANGSWMRLQYDAAGRLVKVKDDNDQTILTYTYGSTRERLIAQEGNESSIVKTYYAWQDGAVIAEFSNSYSNDSIVWGKNYIYLGGRLLATQISLGTGEAVEFSHPDLLGTRLVTNAADGTAFEQVNLPFGVALQSESTVGAANRRFTSYDRSSTTGLDYAVNRFYDPMQGRFTQADPIGMEATSLDEPQSLNLFAYVNNDPVNKVDPDGLWGFSISFGGGGNGGSPTIHNGGWLGVNNIGTGGNSLATGLFNFFFGFFHFVFGSPSNIPVSNLLTRTPLNYASFVSNTTTASSAPSAPPVPGFDNEKYGSFAVSATYATSGPQIRNVRPSRRGGIRGGPQQRARRPTPRSPRAARAFGPGLNEQNQKQALYDSLLEVTLLPLMGPQRYYHRYPDKMANHHIFPQAKEFAAQWKRLGIDINKYTIRIPRGGHIELHSGIGQGRGGRWNNSWREFFAKYPNATKEQVFRHGNWMMMDRQVIGPMVHYHYRPSSMSPR